MTAFSIEVLLRLPLAEAVLRLWSYVTERSALDEFYETHRCQGYERILSFGVVTRLMMDALWEHGGSARQSLLRAQERERLPVSLVAVYGKLGRFPLSLSQSFLSYGTQRMERVMPDLPLRSLPESLAGLRPIVVDGKKLKNAAKRLKVLRGHGGSLLGGKVLAALDVRRGLVLAFSAHPDGESNDVPLVPALLPQVREQVKEPILWIADRQFCDLNLPVLFTQWGNHFLVRQSLKIGFIAREDEPASPRLVNEQGHTYWEEWGWLGSARDPRQRLVRRIVLERAGEETIWLVTDLTDSERYPACDLLVLYLERWGIEQVFQQVTEVFGLQRLIGSTPQGMIFQCSLCLMMYNMLQVMRAYLAQAQELPCEAISTENVFTDAKRQLIAWSELGSIDDTVSYLEENQTVATIKEDLQRLLGNLWHKRWLKAPKKKTSSNLPTTRTNPGGHTSTWRIMQAAKRAAS